MEKKKHIERHKVLHGSLDELVADYVNCTKKSLRETSLMVFMKWSAKQIISPNDEED